MGHVYKDVTQPTGLRYLFNSISLYFDSGDKNND